jgi:acetoin utilization deacetylase AcuC-like enzyme
MQAVANGTLQNAYALSRPPGHHCLPEWSNGFCLLANIAVAIEAVQPLRVAVVDWDVHHGNGTEAIFYDRDDVLTISMHQENNYPLNTGSIDATGEGAGLGFNMNIPLPPGAGHESYLYAFNRLVLPRLHAFKPDLIVVACGFDASGVDPLSRMLCSAETYRLLTRALMQAAQTLCDGKLVMAHEGGYSEVHVPFCGHAVLQEMSGSGIDAGDALGARIAGQQPSEYMKTVYRSIIDSFVEAFGL